VAHLLSLVVRGTGASIKLLTPGQCKPMEEKISKDDYESVISNTDWNSDKPIAYSVLNQY
jgi:hypothetical protein